MNRDVLNISDLDTLSFMPLQAVISQILEIKFAMSIFNKVCNMSIAIPFYNLLIPTLSVYRGQRSVWLIRQTTQWIYFTEILSNCNEIFGSKSH